MIPYFVENKEPEKIGDSETLFSLAVKLAYENETRWNEAKENWISRLTQDALINTLSDEEIKNNINSKYKEFKVDFNSNSISLYKKALKYLGIYKEAINSFHSREIEAMKINPNYNENDIDLYIKKINRTQEEVNFDKLKKRHLGHHLLEDVSELIQEKEIASQEANRTWKGISKLTLRTKLDKQKILYEVYHAWASYDDADESYCLYSDEQEAMKSYNN